MSIRLSLICPTIGRESLERTIKSAVPQLQEGDEMIVVGDGPQPEARSICKKFPQVRYLELPEKVGDYGCSPCDMGIDNATGDAVFFIGDDDQTAPGAFEVIRGYLTEEPGVPHAFGRKHGIWAFKPFLAISNISGQQLVVPLDRAKIPRMSDVSKSLWETSDWEFISRVHEAWGKQTRLHNEPIAFMRTG